MSTFTLSTKTARSLSGIYIVAACLYANGLDTVYDSYINANRRGKTAKGAGFRYNLKGNLSELPVETIEVEGRKFNRVTDLEFVSYIVETFGKDPVVAAILKEAEASYRNAAKNVPAAVFARRK